MEAGLIKIILLNKSLFNWFAKITEVAEIFVATTSVFSLMISCTNELINCTYKKLVYLIAGLSERPHPIRSIAYTVCFLAKRLVTLIHSSDEEAAFISCTSKTGLPEPIFV